MTDEEINKIKKDYKKGFKYNEIESKYNITHSKLNSLIRKYKWKRKSNRSKVQKGNQNAKGNKGGTGAKEGNQNAFKTGEYQTIFKDALNEVGKWFECGIQIEYYNDIKAGDMIEVYIMDQIKR